MQDISIAETRLSLAAMLAGRAAMTIALMAMSWSPVLGLSVIPAPQPQQLEDRCMAGALALAPVPLEDAADAVRRLGVARVDGAIDSSLAVALKQRTLDEMFRRSDRWVKTDERMVPGTRLRFREAVEIEFDDGARSDILMPLEDELVDTALRQALQKLAPVLAAAAKCLPSGDEPQDDDVAINLEVIECAVLWSRFGSSHQSLHADYLRRGDSLGDEEGDADEAAYSITDDAGEPMSLEEVEGQLEECGLAELEEMCKDMQQSTEGGTDALIKRILAALQAGEEEEEEGDAGEEERMREQATAAAAAAAAEEEEEEAAARKAAAAEASMPKKKAKRLEKKRAAEAAAANVAEEEEAEDDAFDESSPFDWDAMSAADDDENDDASFDMPPRLVTFVYLQDCPTAAHGPTAFLPGSATAEAHLMRAVGDDDALVEAFGAAHIATVRAGDAVTYDASVLHYGAANAVEGNDRMVLYFSVARAGAAAASFAAAGEESPEWLDAVDPIPLSSYAT